MMTPVVEPVTVWRVRLRRGDVRDAEGTLRLDGDALVFEDHASSAATTLELSTVRSARRVRGSPILLVAHVDGDERVETAFYFSQPPPLDTRAGESPTGRPIGSMAAMRGASKRGHRRENVKYLTARAGRFKQEIREWVEEIEARARGSSQG